MSKENNFDNSINGLSKFKQYLVPVRKCDVCGGSKRVVWASSKLVTTYACSSCGLVYLGKQLDKEGREKFYSSGGYFELQNDSEDYKKRLKMYKLEVNFLEKHRQSGKLLDVGCGGGFFLDAFNPKWKKFGLEIDSLAVEYANKNYPMYKIVRGEIEDVDYPEGFFDVIVMRGVIEHLSEPSNLVKRLSGWLKKGGLLYVTSTPNVDCLCAELYRDKWKLATADHQFHFSMRALKTLMKRIGLQLTDYHYFYLETPYADERANYMKIIKDAELIFTGKKNLVKNSPAFYGSMLSAIFKKN